jgi:hypothetical protein
MEEKKYTEEEMKKAVLSTAFYLVVPATLDGLGDKAWDAIQYMFKTYVYQVWFLHHQEDFVALRKKPDFDIDLKKQCSDLLKEFSVFANEKFKEMGEVESEAKA